MIIISNQELLLTEFPLRQTKCYIKLKHSQEFCEIPKTIELNVYHVLAKKQLHKHSCGMKFTVLKYLLLYSIFSLKFIFDFNIVKSTSYLSFLILSNSSLI